MLQQNLSLLFLILSFMFSHSSVSASNSNVYVQCSQLNFTSTTPYESNVNSLFTSLIDSASVYNFNKFETSLQSDNVYGLFQCRGDLSSPNCKDCVASAISQLKTSCPMATCGQIQLEGCFVKYDDTSFFGADDKTEVSKKCGPSIGYNSDVLNRIDDALANLVGGNEQYFRGGDFGSIRGVAQCVQDLSLSDCHDCLLEASGRLRSECETSTWGDMYLGKCYIRYADQDNSNIDDDNDKSKSHKRKGKGRKFSYGSLIGSFFGAFFGGGLTVYVTFTCSCCNKFVYNNQINNLMTQLEDLKKDKKIAYERAEKAEKAVQDITEKYEKKGVEVKKKISEPTIYGPPIMPPPCPYMPMPPPCPYGPHSSQNTCFYM